MKETDRRFIGFFDILGFKEWVAHDEHSHILDKLTKLTFFMENIKEEGNLILEKKKSTILKSIINPVVFSDTFLFISNDDSNDSFEDILITTIAFIQFCFEEGVPIKGCISAGELTADFEKSIFFGQPLINAYLLEEELELYGCLIDHHFEHYLNKYEKDINMQGLIVDNYKTPLKNGKINHKLVNWAYAYKTDKEDIIDVIKKFYFKVSGKPRRYIDNTIDFIKFLYPAD